MYKHFTEKPEYKVYSVLADVDRGLTPPEGRRFHVALAVARGYLDVEKTKESMVLSLTEEGRREIAYWRERLELDP